MNESRDPAIQPESERPESAELKEMRLKRASPKPDGRNAYFQLKILIVERLSAYIESEREILEDANLRPLLLEQFSELLKEERIVLKSSERRKLIEDVLAELLGPDPRTSVDKTS